MLARSVLPKFFFLALFVLAGGCDSTNIDDDPPLPSGALFTVLEEASHFGTFPQAASQTGISTSIGGSGDATFFIPDDEAFHLMSPETLDGLAEQQGVLRRVLLRHVVQGSVSLEDLGDGDVLQTAEGTPLSVTVDDEGTVFLDGVRVEEEVGTTNRGPIYRVKSVFRNHLTVEERVAASPLLSHAFRLFGRSGVSLSQPGTFLIPIDRGFEFYPGGGLASFDDQANESLLIRTLQHLVIPDRVLTSDELVAKQSVTTQTGDALRIAEENGVIDLASGLELPHGEANVLARDLQASNGVFHLVERPIQGHLTLWERVNFFDELRLFTQLVGDLETTLNEQEGLTVFAPIQSTTIDSIGARGIDQLLSTEDTPFRQLLVDFHLSPQDIPSTEFINGEDFPTLAGEDIYVRPNTFRNVTPTVALAIPTDDVDLPALNGRLHLMQDLLNPRSIDPFDQLILAGSGDFRAVLKLTEYENLVRGPAPVTLVPPRSIHDQLFEPQFACRAMEIVQDHFSPEAQPVVFPPAGPGSVSVENVGHRVAFDTDTEVGTLVYQPNPEFDPETVGFSPYFYFNFETQNGSYIHPVEAQFRYQNRQNLPPC